MELETYDKAFESFLNSREYDTANSATYNLASGAFKAGWKAAKDPITLPNRLFDKRSDESND
jgi:hypothetical protein